ncbi:hypothetical protein [Nocardioides caldifontis]|uniref:hypothetical protein n=1 Tax=Nocardioides caldifontis TaxID=2588938 RepID=UPI001396BBC6|nr:hypothetical protein [Nocardioides caldifontis]
MAENFRRIEEHDNHAEAQHRTECGCGQELDLCSTGYCPRCGHRVDTQRLATIS